jgi:gamma-glutamylcyclotransferase (GGCT)/AIG2-like uncharacterized protein YtfP
MEKINKNYIFVYGSLRKNMINHGVLDALYASYIGIYKTVNNYYMIGLKSKAYPYILEESVNNDLVINPVYGEVYTISDEGLEYLDRLEGHPNNYIRENIDVINNISSLNTYMYILKNKEMIDSIRVNFNKRFIAVPDNDWKKFLEV